MAILTKFCQRSIELKIGVTTKRRFWRIRREWRFWRNFAKSDWARDRGTDEAAILTNSARMANLTKFHQRAIQLEIGVPTKRRFWRIRWEWRFWQNFAKGNWAQDRSTDQAAILTNPAYAEILTKFRQRASELKRGINFTESKYKKCIFDESNELFSRINIKGPWCWLFYF